MVWEGSVFGWFQSGKYSCLSKYDIYDFVWGVAFVMVACTYNKATARALLTQNHQTTTYPHACSALTEHENLVAFHTETGVCRLYLEGSWGAIRV